MIGLEEEEEEQMDVMEIIDRILLDKAKGESGRREEIVEEEEYYDEEEEKEDFRVAGVDSLYRMTTKDARLLREVKDELSVDDSGGVSLIGKSGDNDVSSNDESSKRGSSVFSKVCIVAVIIVAII